MVAESGLSNHIYTPTYCAYQCTVSIIKHFSTVSHLRNDKGSSLRTATFFIIALLDFDLILKSPPENVCTPETSYASVQKASNHMKPKTAHAARGRAASRLKATRVEVARMDIILTAKANSLFKDGAVLDAAVGGSLAEEGEDRGENEELHDRNKEGARVRRLDALCATFMRSSMGLSLWQ